MASVPNNIPGFEREGRFCATVQLPLPLVSSSGSISFCAEPWSAAPIRPCVVIPLPYGRVLVVDDNEDLALLFSTLIEMMGYETCTVFSAKAAIEAMSTYSPHVVFSDIGMPEMSGYDLAQMIRGGNSPQPLLVSVSGWNDAKTINMSLDSGFDLHLVKPVSYDQVSLLLLDYFQSVGFRRKPKSR